jgi:hypothetical protein
MDARRRFRRTRVHVGLREAAGGPSSVGLAYCAESAEQQGGPVAAVVDFELTLSMPSRLTADTGGDALPHAVEAYVSRKAHPFSDDRHRPRR